RIDETAAVHRRPRVARLPVRGVRACDAAEDDASVPTAVAGIASDGRSPLRPVRQGAAAIGSAVLGDAPLACEANLGRRSFRQGGTTSAAQRALHDPLACTLRRRSCRLWSLHLRRGG